jgi:hypothetical protein
MLNPMISGDPIAGIREPRRLKLYAGATGIMGLFGKPMSGTNNSRRQPGYCRGRVFVIRRPCIGAGWWSDDGHDFGAINYCGNRVIGLQILTG